MIIILYYNYVIAPQCEHPEARADFVERCQAAHMHDIKLEHNTTQHNTTQHNTTQHNNAMHKALRGPC